MPRNWGSRKLGSEAMAQLSESALNLVPAEEANSIAMIVRHLHGNLISRFTDFLTSDGEKEWRDRVAEFEQREYARSEVEAYWLGAWTHLEKSLATLSDDDLCVTVTIKGQQMTVDAAICRALAHVAYHTGQIVLLARMVRAVEWKYLTSPRSAG